MRDILFRTSPTLYDATGTSLSAFSNSLPRSICLAKLSAPIVVSVPERVNTRQGIENAKPFPPPSTPIPCSPHPPVSPASPRALPQAGQRPASLAP